MTKQIDKMTHDDVAYIPLYVQENIFAVKDDIDYTPDLINIYLPGKSV